MGSRMSYTIKHMGLGGILDQAIAIMRDHFVLLASIMMILLFPVLIVQHFLAYSITPVLPPNPTMQDYLHAQQVQAQYWPWFSLFALLQSLILLPLANAAVIHAVAR